jgi:hypothetical protein
LSFEVEFDILRPGDALAARRLLLKEDAIAYVSAPEINAAA